MSEKKELALPHKFFAPKGPNYCCSLCGEPDEHEIHGKHQPSSDWVQKAAEEAATEIYNGGRYISIEKAPTNVERWTAIIRAAIERNKR